MSIFVDFLYAIPIIFCVGFVGMMIFVWVKTSQNIGEDILCFFLSIFTLGMFIVAIHSIQYFLNKF